MSDQRNASSTGKPMRIAMIGHKFIPSRNGGVEVVVSSLVQIRSHYN